MTHPTRPSTRALTQVAGIGDVPALKPEDETYRVYQAVIALSDALFRDLGQDAYEHAAWWADAATLTALRDALADNRENYAGQAIAHFLVRTGCRREETLCALHSWDAIVFNWQKAGYSAQSIQRRIIESGVAEDFSPSAVSRVAAWLENPSVVSSASYTIPSVLFGETRVAYSALRDVGFEPRHDELLMNLATTSSPRIEITEVMQLMDRSERFIESNTTVVSREGTEAFNVPIFSDEGAHWVIKYKLEGVQQAFFARANGTWMDVAAVLQNFDTLATKLRRPERAFQFAFGRADNAEHGFFISAHSERFAHLAQQLFIPLESMDEKVR